MSLTHQNDINDALRQANEALSTGHLPYADFFARNILESVPEHPGAHNVLGIVAAILGLYDQATAHFCAALASDGGFAGAKDNLARLAGLPAPPPTRTERFLLIKAWGFGFWSDVSHVLGGLLLAEITGRTPVVHWGINSRFSGGANVNAFALYFTPVSAYTLEMLSARKNADFFPDKWSVANMAAENNAKWEGAGARISGLYYLGRPETIAVSDFYINVADLVPWIPAEHSWHGQSTAAVYRALIKKYLKPQERITEAVDAFAQRAFTGGPVLAVHVRGSDKKAEMPDLDRINRLYFDTIDREAEDWRIFLLTDDARWLDAFRSRYSARLVTTDCRRTDNDTGMHYMVREMGVELGSEVMVDTYLALRCQKFIGNGRPTCRP